MSKGPFDSSKPVHFSGFNTITEAQIAQDVIITGMCKIPHNFECGALKVSGNVQANESIIVRRRLFNAGIFHVAGNLIVSDDMKCSGTTQVNGNMTIQGVIETSGVLHVGGDFVGCNGVRFAGSASIHRGAQVRGEFNASGMLQVGNHLVVDAGKVKVAGISAPGVPNTEQSAHIGGSIYAQDRITLKNVIIIGDIYGTEVIIQKGVQVNGVVYYTDLIEVADPEMLAAVPENISHRQLKEIHEGAVQPIGTTLVLTPEMPPAEPSIVLTPEEVAAVAEATGHMPIPARGVNYCPQCGSPLLEAMRFCPFCGLKIGD